MNTMIEKLFGMDKMSDQVIATDFLMSSKSGIQNYAVAITETTSPKLRVVLINQMNAKILSYEQISDYMMKMGFNYAYNLEEQYQVDMQVTDTALGLKTTMN